MRAAWYERQSPARDVLVVGELPEPVPATGEVRVRLSRSGVNTGDVKKRAGWLGSTMSYPRVVPHSDGAGVIDAVGDTVGAARTGQRVWVWGAQSYRAFGTAAEAVTVPERLAVPLPDRFSDDLGATLGIPWMTAHRAVFGDGPVAGEVVLVHGVRGGVGSFAVQLAHWGGASVIGSVRRGGDPAPVPGTDHVVALDDPDIAAKVREVAPEGVDRIVEVALSANIELDAELVRNGAVIAAYASPEPPTLPFWSLLFANVTLRLLGSDDFPVHAQEAAVRDLPAAAADGALTSRIAPVYELEDVAAPHEAVENGSRHGRVLIAPGDYWAAPVGVIPPAEALVRSSVTWPPGCASAKAKEITRVSAIP